MKVHHRASHAVTSMNYIESSKKPTYSEKSALLEFGVFEHNRPEADLKKTLVSMSVLLKSRLFCLQIDLDQLSLQLLSFDPANQQSASILKNASLDATLSPDYS